MSKLPRVMKGVVLTGHGGTDKLQYHTDLPVPSPRRQDVLIRVRAAGVNNTDINTRTAWYSKSEGSHEDASWGGQALSFPRIQGADVCGEIIAVGENINPDRIGERVLIEPCIREVNGQPLEQPWHFGSECDGGFAEYTVVSAMHAHAINSQLSDVELASFPCSYSTAENLLTRANVKATDRVLVTGASGGVGSAAVQLAKARGAEVIAITSPAKSQEMIALGASQVIHRNASATEALGENAVDVVVDMVGGDNWPALLQVLKPQGRYAVAGAIAGPNVTLDIRTLYLKDLSFFGCTVLEPDVFSRLIQRIERGDIQPLVAETFELADIVEAQEMFLQKQHIGKIVLSVADGSTSR
ncbi:MAG TPA: alcohol dehydrogenase [Gammaproteobacteria bacterium]|nr:alcohol dehydrogenase [Gammaproteobacteria bacterium]